ncbi:MAG: PDZ domain-containing protein [Acidimicrobiia bacterium]
MKKNVLKISFLSFGSFISIALLIAIITLNIIKVDKVIIKPGTSENVNEKISIKGIKTYKPDGEIQFLTVYVSTKKPSYIEYLKAKYIDKDVEIFSWKEINGDQTSKQNEELNIALMNASQNIAKVVALNKLGCTVTQNGDGAYVSVVQKKSPASKVLVAGDVITKIDTNEVKIESDVSKYISSKKPGDEALVTYISVKDKKTKTVKFILAKSPYQKNTGFLGVGVVTKNQSFDFPVKINIELGDVSGPSAGLAFTLSILDQMTKGSLTGDQKIAATGEMYTDGVVEKVGGVKEKTVAARKAGAKIFLVPKGEASKTKNKSGDMKVFEVSTIDEALSILEKNGGDPISHMQRCPVTD